MLFKILYLNTLIPVSIAHLLDSMQIFYHSSSSISNFPEGVFLAVGGGGGSFFEEDCHKFDWS